MNRLTADDFTVAGRAKIQAAFDRHEQRLAQLKDGRRPATIAILSTIPDPVLIALLDDYHNWEKTGDPRTGPTPP